METMISRLEAQAADLEVEREALLREHGADTISYYMNDALVRDPRFMVVLKQSKSVQRKLENLKRKFAKLQREVVTPSK